MLFCNYSVSCSSPWLQNEDEVLSTALGCHSSFNVFTPPTLLTHAALSASNPSPLHMSTSSSALLLCLQARCHFGLSPAQEGLISSVVFLGVFS